ncbi:MAG: hypothetical protein SPI74_00435 [Eubacterium sp.]|nr:hypothetical protein [Eubacterium sp.]
MKNLIIIIGTMILGVIIVNTLVLGDGNSMKSAAENIIEKGIHTIDNLKLGDEV